MGRCGINVYVNVIYTEGQVLCASIEGKVYKRLVVGLGWLGLDECVQVSAEPA